MADRGEEIAARADGDGHQKRIGTVAQLLAKLAPIGAITSTVAALLRKGVTAMATA